MEAASTPNRSISMADDWQEFTSADFGPEIDLTRDGQYPRLIITKAYGDLRLRSARNHERVLTNLPEGYIHRGNTKAILPGQTAALIVYW